jgi:hypothetical protein
MAYSHSIPGMVLTKHTKPFTDTEVNKECMVTVLEDVAKQTNLWIV